jgi:hypothetical protein
VRTSTCRCNRSRNWSPYMRWASARSCSRLPCSGHESYFSICEQRSIMRAWRWLSPQTYSVSAARPHAFGWNDVMPTAQRPRFVLEVTVTFLGSRVALGASSVPTIGHVADKPSCGSAQRSLRAPLRPRPSEIDIAAAAAVLTQSGHERYELKIRDTEVQPSAPQLVRPALLPPAARRGAALVGE